MARLARRILALGCFALLRVSQLVAKTLDFVSKSLNSAPECADFGFGFGGDLFDLFPQFLDLGFIGLRAFSQCQDLAGKVKELFLH